MPASPLVSILMTTLRLATSCGRLAAICVRTLARRGVANPLSLWPPRSRGFAPRLLAGLHSPSRHHGARICRRLVPHLLMLCHRLSKGRQRGVVTPCLRGIAPRLTRRRLLLLLLVGRCRSSRRPLPWLLILLLLTLLLTRPRSRGCIPSTRFCAPCQHFVHYSRKSPLPRQCSLALLRSRRSRGSA